MADISRITDLSGTTYDIKDAVARSNSVYYVEGSPEDTTAGTWTGTIDNLTEYYDGLTVIFVPAIAGASTTTLNINELGAITCYYNGTTKLTTQYAVGTPILLTYRQGFWRRADYDSNTTNIARLYHYNGQYTLDSALYRYQLLFQIDDNLLTPLNNASNSTGTSKAMLTDVEFNPFGKIFYYNSTATVGAGSNASGSTLFFSFEAINLLYSFNCGTTLTEHRPIYLVVIPQTNGLCKIASSLPISQELPTSNDGYWYIFLGRTYSTYQMSLHPHHPVYRHNGTKVVEVLPIDVATASDSGLMSATDKTKLDGIESGAQVNPGNATSSAAGLMSASDKSNLDTMLTEKMNKPIVVSGSITGSNTSKSVTLSDSRIISTMRPILELSNESVFSSNVTITVSAGQVVVSGTLKGTSTVTVILYEPA